MVINTATALTPPGGPLIDIEGRVLGVSVPLSRSGRDAGVELYDSGIGFAATIADIEGLLEKMKRGEVLHRAWLGVGFDTTDLGPGAGLASVSGESVAYGAGLRQGDRILEVDHTPVLNGFHLQMMISAKMAGDPVHLMMRRGDQEPAGVTVFLAATPAAERTEEKEGDLRSAFPWDRKDE